MIGQALHAVRDYLGDVFVSRFDAWAVVGIVAQLTFSARFIVQWIASERARRSVVPVSFWWLSLLGGALLFVYALSRRDLVFIVGQGAGFAIYARNLMLISARGKAMASGAEGDRA